MNWEMFLISFAMLCVLFTVVLLTVASIFSFFIKHKNKNQEKKEMKTLSEQRKELYKNGILSSLQYQAIILQDKEFIKEEEKLIHLLLNKMITKDEFWNKRDKLAGKELTGEDLK